MLMTARVLMASLILALATIAPANAGSLDDAKAAGLIGERVDGYVGALTEDAGVQALVDEINAGRKAKYAEIAGKRGAPVDAVAAIAGKKLIERTPSGQFVLDSEGEWQRK